MYSPKISDELVPNLYKIVKAKGIAMTELVNTIISEAIKNIKIETHIIKEKVETEVEKEVYVVK